MNKRPTLLFVCVKNGGKSQMAAALMAASAGESVNVGSAGTKPGSAVNKLSAESLAEIGLDITGEVPKALTHEMVSSADIVVTLGREARVEPIAGTRFENWNTDEPAERGVEGIERMRLIREDITARVAVLRKELLPGGSA